FRASKNTVRVACGNAGGVLRDKNPFDKQKHLNCKSAHLWHYQKNNSANYQVFLLSLFSTFETVIM
ncbi:MAG: hypothetical protein ACI920_002736, partial [Saprospiraceae bacterium]